MTNLYLDASAITKLIIEEDESEILAERVAGQQVVSSRIAVVEVTKAVARANPRADPQPVLSRFTFVELDPELARLAGATGEPGLRALDAIHIASAVRLGSELDAFITFDERQAAAGSKIGLPIEAPGPR